MYEFLFDFEDFQGGRGFFFFCAHLTYRSFDVHILLFVQVNYPSFFIVKIFIPRLSHEIL